MLSIIVAYSNIFLFLYIILIINVLENGITFYDWFKIFQIQQTVNV